MSTEPVIAGIVLAAGAGTRMGGPKALLRLGDGTPWVARSTTVLLEAGCSTVVVVLGAQARLALPLVPIDPRVTAIMCDDWADGMSRSLVAGLAAATGDAVLVTLVDLPALPAAVVRRVLEADGPLRQAVFDGRPGHPVYLAHEHWAAVSDDVSGDEGARRYLRANGVAEIECGDLWDGTDIDS